MPKALHYPICLALFLFTGNLSAQYSSPDLRESAADVLKTSDDDFRDLYVFDHWKNESVVVLCAKTERQLTRMGHANFLHAREITRRRIALLDKAGIEEYSEIEFQKGDDLAIRIIKPDGTKVNIDNDDAVEIESGLSNVFFSYSYTRKMKLAIAGLEPGDHLEIVRFHDTYGQWIRSQLRLRPYLEYQTYRIPEAYPVQRQVVEVTMNRGFHLNASVLHDSSSWKEIDKPPFIYYKRNHENKYFKTYRLHIKDAPPIKHENWVGDRTCLPRYKFGLSYTLKKNQLNRGEYLGDDRDGGIHESIPMDKLHGLLIEEFSPYVVTGTGFYEAVNKLVKKTKLEALEKAKQVFYAARHSLVLEEPYRRGDAAMTTKDANMWRTAAFTFWGLQRLGLKPEVFFYAPRFQGEIEDITSIHEMVPVTAIVIDGTRVYMTAHQRDLQFGQLPEELEGLRGMLINIYADEDDIGTDYRIVELPYRADTLNRSTTITRVKADPGSDALIMQREHAVRGQNRLEIASGLVPSVTLIESENKKYRVKPPIWLTGATKSKYRKKIREFDERAKKEVKKSAEKDAQRQMLGRKVELITLDLANDGRYDEKGEDFILRDSLHLHGTFQKSGSDYLLGVGRFVGRQVDIDEEQRVRDCTAWHGTARRYENHVIIEVPEGWSLEGLEALNDSIDNDAGQFVVRTWVDTLGQANIQVRKVYKRHHESPEDWPLLVDVLDRAVAFRHKSVLMRKLAD